MSGSILRIVAEIITPVLLPPRRGSAARRRAILSRFAIFLAL
jgi:hypothetical protein